MTFWKHSRCYQCPKGPWLATVIMKCSTIIFPVTTLLKSPFFNSGLIHRPSISGWIKSPLPSVPAVQKWKTERRWRAACSLQQPGMKTMVRSVQTHTHTHTHTHTDRHISVAQDPYSLHPPRGMLPLMRHRKSEPTTLFYSGLYSTTWTTIWTEIKHRDQCLNQNNSNN
jgi:hypothetical protein